MLLSSGGQRGGAKQKCQSGAAAERGLTGALGKEFNVSIKKYLEM